jgi:hypothetical protein
MPAVVTLQFQGGSVWEHEGERIVLDVGGEAMAEHWFDVAFSALPMIRNAQVYEGSFHSKQ